MVFCTAISAERSLGFRVAHLGIEQRSGMVKSRLKSLSDLRLGGSSFLPAIVLPAPGPQPTFCSRNFKLSAGLTALCIKDGSRVNFSFN
jgi:hypothetical protein